MWPKRNRATTVQCKDIVIREAVITMTTLLTYRFDKLHSEQMTIKTGNCFIIKNVVEDGTRRQR